MHRTHVAALVCALLVAVAGCTGNGDQPTVTPAEVPELTGVPVPTTAGTPTPSPTASEVGPGTARRTARPNASVGGVAFPPGTDRRGVVDPEALVAAQRRAAAGGYVLVVNETQEVFGDGGRETTQSRRLVVRAPDPGPIRNRITRSAGPDSNATVSVYANSTALFVRQAAGGNVSYERRDAVNLGIVREEIVIRELSGQVGAVDWRPEGPTTVDGAPAISFRFVADSEDVQRSRGQLIATESGVVRLLTFRTVTRSDGRRVVQSFTYRFEPRANLTVARPDWLEEAATGTADR